MNTSPRPRHAFTLVELLVVITIIGILAGLITAAAIRARISAKQAVVKMEIEQLAMALEQYKNEVGEYPPDFVFLQGCSEAGSESDDLETKARKEILRHLRKRFPRYEADWGQFCAAVKKYNENMDPDNFTPASALLFFLGGVPEQTGSDWIPAGFHQNPSDPFATGGPRTKPFFEFNRERIKPASGTSGTLSYYPPGIEAPYVYFKSRSKEYGATDSGLTQVYPSFFRRIVEGEEDFCVPYLEPSKDDSTGPEPNVPAKPRLWRSPNKFQIITAGLDGRFGGDYLFRYTKSGEEIQLNGSEPTLWDEGNFDNLTNFAAGTLEDEMQ